MEYLVLKKAVGEDVVLTKTVPYRQLIKADQKCELLGVETFTISVETTEPINFQIGDYIRAFKRRYWVNDPKNISVSDLGDKLVYDVQLEGIQYRFLNAVLLDMGASGFATGTDVVLDGTLKEIISIIVDSVNFNENREMIVVDMNSIPETKRMQISFSDTNCLAALQTVCSNDYFKMVFKLVEKNAENESNYQYELKIGETVGIDRPYVFSVGDVGGAYDIKRVKTDNAGSMFTRLFAFGSSDNIPTNYRNYSAKLRLPTTISDSVYLPSNIELINDENKNLTYIQLKDVTQHISKSITYSDIKPHRTGVVSDVEGDSVFKFFDADIDFDINEKNENGDSKYLLGGESAKLHFNTGKLAGLEFEFTYITAQKAFILKSFKDEKGRQFPDPDSTAFRVAAGDEYVILNVNMPDEYIEDAEDELLSTSIKDLQNSLKVVNKFTLKVKELYLKKQQIGESLDNFFEVGDFVSVKDKTMEDAKRIQVLSFSRSYFTPYAYTVDLSDTVTLDYLTQVLGDINSLQEVVINNKLDDPARTKRNWMATVELAAMIDTVRAEALLIGNDPAAQYNMSQTIVRTNYQSNANRIAITASVIQHNCYPLSSPGGIWNVMSADIGGINPASPLYVYIKANIANNVAMYYFSLTKLAVDIMPGVYLFPFGILSSVIEGARVFTTTKGFTLITGDNIRTGRIESYDGLNYFDLSGGKFRVGDANSEFSWNKNGDSKLRIKGSILVDKAGNESAPLIDRGTWLPDAMYVAGNYFQYAGSSYKCVVDTPYVGISPLNTTYFTPFAVKGEQGDPGAPGTPGIPGTPGTPGAPGEDGKDGKDYEFIFKRTQVFAQPTTPASLQQDDYVPSGWTDDMAGVDATWIYEWVCKRYKIAGVWNNFSTPALWAKYSFNGDPGEPGTPGENAISVSLSKNIVNVSCNANGDPRTGTIPTDVFAYAFDGGSAAEVDEWDYSVTSGTASLSGINISKGIFKLTINSISTDIVEISLTAYINQISGAGILQVTKYITIAKTRDGYAGPAIVSRGAFVPTTTYYGTSIRVDAVSVTTSGVSQWYLAKTNAGGFSGVTPGITIGWEAKWDIMPSFDMIATGMLLAENANIAEFIFNGGKLRSQYPTLASMENKNLIIDGVSGKITALDAVINGHITADTGRIGPLNILTQGLISGNIKISNYPVTPLTVLKVASYEYLSRESTWRGMDDPEGRAYTQAFNVQNKGTIQFKIQAQASAVGWKWELRRASGGYLVASGQDELSTSKTYQEVFVYPDSYYLSAIPYTRNTFGYIVLYGADADDIISNRYYDSRTVLADGGFYCFKDEKHYLYCQPSSLFELRIGNGGLKVTDSAVFKMTDGTNWNPL